MPKHKPHLTSYERHKQNMMLSDEERKANREQGGYRCPLSGGRTFRLSRRKGPVDDYNASAALTD